MIVSGINKERVAAYVVDRFEEFRQARSVKEQRWLECIRAYLCDFDMETLNASPGRSKRYYGITHDAVESIHSQLMAMILPDDKWMFVEPEVPGQLQYDDDAAEQARKLLEIRTRRADFKRVCSAIIKQLIITGNCPYTVSWHREYLMNYPAFRAAMNKWQSSNREKWQKYVSERQMYDQVVSEAKRLGLEPPPMPDFEIPEPPNIRNDGIAYSGPKIEMGDIFNFVIDPYASDQKTALRIRRTWVSRETIRALAQPGPDGYAVYEGINDIGVLSESDRKFAADDYQEEINTAFGLSMPSKNSVMLYEAWGTMEIPGDEPDTTDVRVAYTATVANGELIRFEPTFFWTGDAPLQLATYNDVPGQVYGIGGLEPNLGTANLINARANQLVDVVAFAVNPEYKIMLDGTVDPFAKSAPGRRHPVAEMDNLAVLPKDLRGIQIGIQDLDMLVREFRSMTRAMSPAMGGAKQSATRTALDANIVGTDLGKIGSWIEDTFITKALELFLQLDRQFVNPEELASITQDGETPFKDLSPASLMGGFAIRARGSKHFADRMEQIQGLAAWISMASSNQFLLPIANFLHLGKKYYSLLGFHDENEAFNDEPTAQRILDQMFENGLIGRGGNGNDGTDAEPAGGQAAASPSSAEPAPQQGNGAPDAVSGGNQPGLSRSGGSSGADGGVGAGGQGSG